MVNVENCTQKELLNSGTPSTCFVAYLHSDLHEQVVSIYCMHQLIYRYIFYHFLFPEGIDASSNAIKSVQFHNQEKQENFHMLLILDNEIDVVAIDLK